MRQVIADWHDYTLIIDKQSTVYCFGKFMNWQNTTHISGIPPIWSVSCGNSHCLMLDDDGSVWGLGSNQNMRLGLPQSNFYNSPTRVEGMPEITAISCSPFAHSLFLDVNGAVWSCGVNSFGALGPKHCHTGSLNMIENLPRIESICAGYCQSLLLDVNGTVWALGFNGDGRLGAGPEIMENPQKVEGLPTIRHLSSCFTQSLFLDVDGGVWGCGRNKKGALGTLKRKVFVPEKIPDLPPVASLAGGYHHSLFLDYEGTVWFCGKIAGQKAFKPQKVPIEDAIHDIYAGPNSGILRQSERIWVWGATSYTKFAVSGECEATTIPSLVPGVTVLNASRISTKSARK